MKPHVIMHMATSLDGRIVPTTWPEDIHDKLNEVYEDIHRQLNGDAWIVGRVTMAEFGKGKPQPAKAIAPMGRKTWIAPGAKAPFAIALDQGAKLHLNTDKANDDSVVVILTESASDDHLAELQRDGISYLFAGAAEIDLAAALSKLQAEFGVERLLLEGGGGINASFVRAGLVDEVSLVMVPYADGHDGPTLLTSASDPGLSLELKDVAKLEDGFVHLSYSVKAKSAD